MHKRGGQVATTNKRLYHPEMRDLERITVFGDHTLADYKLAASGTGPLAYDWKDKPHRLLYDLIVRIYQLEG